MSQKMIVSPWYDAGFFFALPLLLYLSPQVLCFVFPQGITPWVMLIAYLHEGMLWGLFADKEWRSVAGGRKLVFLGGPILLFFAMFVSCYFLVEQLLYVHTAVLFWNIHHLTRQNIGILSLYRHRNGSVNTVAHENWSVYLASWGCFLCAFPRIDKMDTLLDVQLCVKIGIACLVSGFFICLTVFSKKKAEQLQSPWLPFYAVSLLFYMPLLYEGVSFGTGFAACFLVHYIQYIGLQSIVQWNRIGSHLRSSMKYVLIAAVAWPMTRWLAQWRPEWASGISVNMLLAFTMWSGITHYFLDRYVWRLAYPDVRHLVLPNLSRRV